MSNNSPSTLGGLFGFMLKLRKKKLSLSKRCSTVDNSRIVFYFRSNIIELKLKMFQNYGQ